MQPIQPVGQGGSSQISAVTEAIARYGVSEDLKDTQRREAAPDPGASSDGLRIPTERLELSGQETSPERSPKHAESPESHGPAPGQDGLREQQDQALAQHASEQHGRHEMRWSESKHAQRSTREQIHSVETSHGRETGRSEKAHGGGEASHAASWQGSHARASMPPSGHGSMSLTLGGDVLAAAVNSGLRSTSELASDEAQGFEYDQNAEQQDSSQEATAARMAQQGKRLSDRTQMQSSLGFGKDQDEQQKREFTAGNFQQGTSDDREQPRREAPAQETAALSAAPAEATHGEPQDVTEPLSQKDPQPVSEQTLRAEAIAPGVHPVPSTPTAPVEVHSEHEGPFDLDTIERTAMLSPGVDLMTEDEYFFFDDARFSPDAA